MDAQSRDDVSCSVSVGECHARLRGRQSDQPSIERADQPDCENDQDGLGGDCQGVSSLRKNEPRDGHYTSKDDGQASWVAEASCYQYYDHEVRD